jgi:hypothetical protein
MVVQDYGENNPMANEKDDGEMQLIDKTGQPLQ